MNMKRIYLMALASLLAVSSQAAGLTGKEIIQRVKDAPDGDTRRASLEMTLVQKNGSKRTRRLTTWSMDIGKDTKTMMFFTYPGDVRGTGFLTWDYDDPRKEDDRWLYLPALKKTRRISGKSSKTDYFMGSDFTYDDMGSRNVDEDTHMLLREEEYEGHRCWVVESVPVDPREIYSKKVVWIRQDCLKPVRADYYDKLDKLHRQFKAADIVRIQDFWTIRHMEIENVQTGHKTLLDFADTRYDERIDAGLFTVATLEKGL